MDLYQERKRLCEKLRDSAPVFEGAKRTLDDFCGDFRVFCGRLNHKVCKIDKVSCPAYAQNLPAYDDKGRVRKLH